MKIAHIGILAAALAGCLFPAVAPAGAPDVAGAWKVTFRGKLGTGTLSLTLAQDGRSVRGELETRDGTRREVTGTFDGKTLVLSRDTGVGTVQRYRAAVKGNTFSGNFANEGKHADSGTIEGKRAPPAKPTAPAKAVDAGKSGGAGKREPAGGGLLGALDGVGKALSDGTGSVARSLEALGVASGAGTEKAGKPPATAKASPASAAKPGTSAKPGTATPAGIAAKPGAAAAGTTAGVPPGDILVSVSPLPLELGDAREMSRTRQGGSAGVLAAGVRVLAGEKARVRLAAEVAAFPAPEPSAGADVLSGLAVDAAAARDVKARALYDVSASWQEAVMAAAYDDENATRQALEQVNLHVRTAGSAQRRLADTASKARQASEVEAARDPQKLRTAARSAYVEQLKATRNALAGAAEGGRWCLVLQGRELPGQYPSLRLKGEGTEASADYTRPDGLTVSGRWTVPAVIVPGQPARVSITVKDVRGALADGWFYLWTGSPRAANYMLAIAYSDANAARRGEDFPSDAFDLVVPDVPAALEALARGGKAGPLPLPMRDQAQMRNIFDTAKKPSRVPVREIATDPSSWTDAKRPGAPADVILRVEFGGSIHYRYAWTRLSDAQVAAAGAASAAAQKAQAFPFHLDREKDEEIRFREANLAIIQRTVQRDEEELARTTDPKARAALEWRILNGRSDLQAEQDLIDSVRTGETVRTRTPFDDWAHDRFVAGIRENQMRIESFQRAQLAIPRLVALLPPDQQAAARDFAARQLGPDARAKMDPAQARKVAEALGKQVQGYWQGEAARHEEDAIRYEDYAKRAETVKLIANVTTLVGGLGAPSPSLAAQVLLSSAEGYVEGGPAGAVQEAVAFYSAPLYAAAEAMKAYPEGGFYGAGSAAAIGFVKSKLSQMGVAPAGQAAAKGTKLTVKELLASAEFKQAQKRGQALVDDFRRSLSELAAARSAGRPIPEVRALERAAQQKAAIAHSDIHAKAFLKYKADAPLQQAFIGQVDGIHHQVEARFHERMAGRAWNPQRLLPIRNSSSAGTVGMDFDIRLVEDGGVTLVQNGRPASLATWQREAQQEWARAYKDVTGRDAGHALENVTTSLHPEAYKDLAWVDRSRGPVDPAWIRQAGDVTRYKATEIMHDRKIGAVDVYTRLYEASRGTAKDLRTKLLDRLGRPGAIRAAPGPDGAREAEERRRQLVERWTAIQGLLDRVGTGSIDPVHADREMRQLTGGYGIPQVIDHASTILGELGRG